jgi:hypothetical protein
MLDCLDFENSALFSASLRAIGNILTLENCEIPKVLLENGLLSKFLPAFKNGNHTQVKEMLWSISNITAGSREHIKFVINDPVMKVIFDLCKNVELDIRKEAVWIICNSITGGDLMSMNSLIQLNGGSVISLLSEALNLQEVRLISNVLDSI